MLNAKELHKLCMRFGVHGSPHLVQHILKVALAWNLAVRRVQQMFEESINCCHFCGYNHGKNSRGRTLVDNHIFSKFNEARWYHIFRQTHKEK